MTGLLNKSGLEREIEKRRHARNRWVAEVHINAMMHAAWSGSNAFDTLVHRVARVFSIRTDIVEVAARVSEKCFGLVIEARSSEQAETICERLSLLVENIEVEGVRLTCSIGIVQIDPSHDAPSIVEAAHVAAEIAAQHSDPEIHLMELNDVAVQRFQKAANVQGVVDSILHHDRIAIFCQPLVPLGECSEMGDRFELLTRIVDEEGRHISACELIADAEANGLAGKIDRAIVRKSFECLYRVYGGSGERRLACASINISASSLGDEALLEIVTTELKRGIIDPGKVCFEITESSSIKDPADAKAFIARMRQCGCSFSLDDFGSESASFVRLLDLGYIEYLKIDGALIQRIDQDPLAFDVVKSISDIAHRMGMRTVAEYVDRESLMSQLRHVGVDFAQGYLVGQPLPFK
jgi:Amt family ammonium transporter